MSLLKHSLTKLTINKNSNIQSPFSTKLKQSLTFPSQSPHTRQEFKEESDINTIMARYMRTGELPHVNTQAPQYFDASGVDFQTHMEAVASAKSLFAQLPSNVRARFANDPGLFIDFCGEDGNRTELAKMGLLSPEATRKALTPTPPSAPAASVPPNASPSVPPVNSGSAAAAPPA